MWVENFNFIKRTIWERIFVRNDVIRKWRSIDRKRRDQKKKSSNRKNDKSDQWSWVKFGWVLESADRIKC